MEAGMEAMRPLTARHFLRWLVGFLEAHNPMAQLRKMRDLERRIRRLTAGRNELILQALACGHSQRQVGIAAGLSKTYVQEIKMKGAVS